MVEVQNGGIQRAPCPLFFSYNLMGLYQNSMLIFGRR